MSAVKTSVSTDSWVGSDSRLTSTQISSEVPTATPVSARNVRVVRSLISSARSRAVMPLPRSARRRRPPGSARRRPARRARPGARRPPRPTTSGAAPRTSSAPSGLGLDGVAAARAGAPRAGRPRAARTRVTGPSAPPSTLSSVPAAAQHAVRDHDHVVDALGDLAEQVARHEHRAAAARPRRAAGRASSGCPAGRGRWRARRGSARRGRPAAPRRSRAAGACPSSSP